MGALVTQAGPFSSAPNAPHALRIALGPIARDPLENALREEGGPRAGGAGPACGTALPAMWPCRMKSSRDAA